MTRHGIDQLLTSSHSVWKTTPIFWFCSGSPTRPFILFFPCNTLCIQAQLVTMKGRTLQFSWCHATKTLPIHPHRKYVPVRVQGGESLLVLCLVLTGLSLSSFHRPIACVSTVCAFLFLVTLYLTQLFLECWGPPRVRNDVRAREQWEGKQRRISAVEFLSSDSFLFLEHNCLVFG